MLNALCAVLIAAGPIVTGPAEADEVVGEFVPTHWNVELHDDILRVGRWTSLKGRPKGWDDTSAVDAGKAFVSRPGGMLTLVSSQHGGNLQISTTIDIPHGTEYLTFLVRLRGPEIEQGKSEDSGAGVTFAVIDANGTKRVMPRIDVSYKGYRNWYSHLRTVEVDRRDRLLNVKVSLVDASGDLDIDDILVIPSHGDDEMSDWERGALSQAIREDDVEAVRELILESPELLETRFGRADNGTPLTVAAWHDSARVAEALIELGADIEAEDHNWHNTPLRWCCWWGNSKVAKVLVDAGARTAGASRMAQSSKDNNPSPRGQPEDFDRISEVIAAAEQLQPSN